ncbi:MAG: hypothetical protein KF802_08875 [Bdellovibrionaceae bacterium]|nr:hypothetical protein [Pseudobdellovibrionaceae bacterium]
MSKGFLKTFVFCGLAAAAIAVAFTNCGRPSWSAADYSSLHDPFGGLSNIGTKRVNTTPYALLNSEQVYKSMLNVTGQAAPTNAQITEYGRRSGALAASGELDLINSPMLIGISSLAGEVCNGLLAKEIALAADQRQFFPGVNFAQGIGALPAASFDDSVHRMARSFWGRDEKPEESAALVAFRADFLSTLTAQQQTQSASTRNLFLGTCAGMLASFDAYTY